MTREDEIAQGLAAVRERIASGVRGRRPEHATRSRWWW